MTRRILLFIVAVIAVFVTSFVSGSATPALAASAGCSTIGATRVNSGYYPPRNDF
jgi:hypothetical protein